MRITYNDKLNKLLNPYLESLLKENQAWSRKRLPCSTCSWRIWTWEDGMVYSVRYWNLVWRRSSGKKTSKHCQSDGWQT